MKNLIRTLTMMLSIVLLFASMSLAQRGDGHGGGNGRGQHKIRSHHSNGNVRHRRHRHNRVVIHRSVYRPRVVVVHHPLWAPNRGYNRRWVYFPRYNFYWDNWRNVYVYRNETIWITNPSLPPALININIGAERNYELNDSEDDIDDVYNTNGKHIETYPSDEQ